MKIGVVSDTHSLEIPREVLTQFKNVDVIIHAGDFCSSKDFNVFKALKKDLYAVYGNMDSNDLRKSLPETKVITLEGVKIGIFHGEGPAKRVLDFVKEKFKGKRLDVVIFGHSHVAISEKKGKTLYFNPGSPNDRITAPFCSYGILEINDGKVESKIIKIN